jgi:3-oxoacyl-[acyl-carrier protein] reductase
MSAHERSRRVALVLAASKGLGRGCAAVLAERGLAVFVCARGEDGLEQTVAALRDQGAEAAGAVCDVSDSGDLQRLLDEVEATYGSLDVLVANAGGPPPGPLLELTDDDWSRGFELTLMSVVRAVRLAVPRMRTAGYGRIVVLGSSSVRHPIPNLDLSNAFRPALVGLVKSLAGVVAANGITVNMVSPGRIATERVRALDERAAEREGLSYEEVRARSERSIPMGRYGSPEDLAALVAFLASEEAGYITGQSILVDGGMIRSLP